MEVNFKIESNNMKINSDSSVFSGELGSNNEQSLMNSKIENIYVVSSWSSLSDSYPFKYTKSVSIGTLMVGNHIPNFIELINDNPIKFAKYGIQISDYSNGTLNLYAIEQPTEAITIKILYGYNPQFGDI